MVADLNQHQTGYPVVLDLTSKRCLVVGGGNIAVRKVEGLVAANADVVVVAPSIHPLLRSLADSITLIEREFRKRDLRGSSLVITCTDDPSVNRNVYEQATARGVWVNSADDPTNCAFTLPSVARRGDLMVTVSTNGKSPALSKWLRQRFEEEFDDTWLELLDILATVRAEVRSLRGTSEIDGWDDALSDSVLDLVRDGRSGEAADVIRGHLGLAVAS